MRVTIKNDKDRSKAMQIVAGILGTYTYLNQATIKHHVDHNVYISVIDSTSIYLAS